jgi:hypothetical protein
MQNKLTKIFQKAKHESDSELVSTVWSAIVLRDKKITRIKLWIFACAGFASLAGLLPAIKILFTDLAKSGLYEYFSLIFSDGGSIISYWKEFIFSLAESLPIMSMIFALSLTFVFFLSLRYVIKQIDRGQSLLTA